MQGIGALPSRVNTREHGEPPGQEVRPPRGLLNLWRRLTSRLSPRPLQREEPARELAGPSLISIYRCDAEMRISEVLYSVGQAGFHNFRLVTLKPSAEE